MLFFLFPNTFKDEREAYDFYKEFCAKAKSAREDSLVYELPQNIWLNYKIDMISGLVTTWNSQGKSPETNFNFYLLPYKEIKNGVLKDEILKIYEDNYEHLNKLGIADKLTNEKLLTFEHFVLDHSGLYKNTHWRYDDFFNDNYCWEKETKNYYLPTESIIDFLRKLKTNQHLLSANEIEEIVNNAEKKYSEFNCKIDINNFEAELSNDIMWISIKTKYFYPAENITFSAYEPNLPYKAIDLS